jgi:DNA-binding GntR family transcriptional regulator
VEVGLHQLAIARQRCDEMLRILEALAQRDPERYSPEVFKVKKALEALAK